MERYYCYPLSFPVPMMLPLFIHYLVGCNLAITLVTNLNTDQSSLLALKSQITSDPYNILTNNWTSETSVCSWFGVRCEHRHNRVTALSIPNMGLKGIIPPEIGNLSFLISLNMSRNFFHGNLPKDLANLHRLQVLDLGQNNFTGHLPPSIFNISTLISIQLYRNMLSGSLPDNVCRHQSDGLQFLSLSRNMLSGQIPSSCFQHCSQLWALSLSYNNFQGSIPTEISNMTALEILYLGPNNFTGVIPKQIGQLQNLKRLNIVENKLVGTVPQEIGYLKELELLGLGSNLLSGSIPIGVFNLSKLKEISLENNILSGEVPNRQSFHLPNLEWLTFGLNELRGPILSSIANCSRLYLLDVYFNHFSGSIPNALCTNLRLLQLINLSKNNFTIDEEHFNLFASLTNCRYLTRLSLDNNSLPIALPPHIGNFSKFLRYLDARFCKIKGYIPNEIGNLTNLSDLYLSGNDLVGRIPPSIRGLQNMERLILPDNRLTGYFPNSLCTLLKLGILSLAGNQFSGPIPECLGNLSALRFLELNQNKFNSSMPAYLWRLTDLMELDISSNFLSGSLRPDIANLKAATQINLSMNELSGRIPDAIGSLLGLIKMSLTHNRLQGPIPDSVSKMLSLKTLDLSKNRLSGVIPKSLETLQHLIYFNVSFNNLSGEIPLGGPFTNFTAQSFMFNNKDLCGDFRFGVLPCAINSLQNPRKKKKFNKVTIVSLGVAAGMIFITLVVLVLMKCQKKNHSTPNVFLSLSPQTHKRISYYELQQGTNGFNDSNLLGTGGFSSVYKGVLQDGTILAVKVFNLEVQGSLRGFDAECEVLRNLRHRNLTRVICSCSNEDFKALVLDYMPNGSLDKWLYSHNHFLDIVQRLNIMINVASALEYLHHGYSTPVIHCDLKPSNVLIDEDMVAHVSDFGMAKLLSTEDSATHTSTLSTLGYMAPEYGMEGIVSPKCDVYSYGIMLMEVFTRTKPSDEIFSGDLSMKTWVQNSLPNEVMQVVDANLLDPNDEDQLNKRLKCLASIMELAISCTTQFPKDRITMKDALSTLGKLKSKLLQRH